VDQAEAELLGETTEAGTEAAVVGVPVAVGPQMSAGNSETLANASLEIAASSPMTLAAAAVAVAVEASKALVEEIGEVVGVAAVAAVEKTEEEEEEDHQVEADQVHSAKHQLSQQWLLVNLFRSRLTTSASRCRTRAQSSCIGLSGAPTLRTLPTSRKGTP